MISGASHTKAPWWRKNKNYKGSQNTQSCNSGLGSNRDESKEDNDSAMDAENSMSDSAISKPTSPRGDLQASHDAMGDFVINLNTSRKMVYRSVRLKEVVDGFSINDKLQDRSLVDSSLFNSKLIDLDASKYSSIPLQGSTNLISFIVPMASAGSTKKWKKRAQATGQPSMNAAPMSVNRHPAIETIDQLGGKKQCLEFCSSYDREKFQVVARVQHHRSL